MGSLTSRPKQPEIWWKPHSTLQAALETFERLLAMGEITGKKIGDEYQLSFNGKTSSAKTLCEAMQGLTKS